VAAVAATNLNPLDLTTVGVDTTTGVVVTPVLMGVEATGVTVIVLVGGQSSNMVVIVGAVATGLVVTTVGFKTRVQSSSRVVVPVFTGTITGVLATGVVTIIGAGLPVVVVRGTMQSSSKRAVFVVT